MAHELVTMQSLAQATARKESFGAKPKQPTEKIVLGEKSHQRIIREKMANTEKVPKEALRLAQSLDNAEVRPVSNQQARDIVLKYEWLGTLGNTRHAYGLFFGEHLAGVACFGSTAGMNVAASVCGPEYAKQAITLVRGACVHWAHPHAASYLIPRACKRAAEDHGYNIFIAYSDNDAGEVGTVYQACNWLYVGAGGAPEKWVHPDGRVVDGRQLTGMTRSRKGRPSIRPLFKSNAPQEMIDVCRKMIRDWEEEQEARGFEIIAKGTDYPAVRRKRRQQVIEDLRAEGFFRTKAVAKGRYVAFYGDKRTVRELRKALKLEVLPYPKRTVEF